MNKLFMAGAALLIALIDLATLWLLLLRLMGRNSLSMVCGSFSSIQRFLSVQRLSFSVSSLCQGSSQISSISVMDLMRTTVIDIVQLWWDLPASTLWVHGLVRSILWSLRNTNSDSYLLLLPDSPLALARNLKIASLSWKCILLWINDIKYLGWVNFTHPKLYNTLVYSRLRFCRL